MSDWSSDVCSSDLHDRGAVSAGPAAGLRACAVRAVPGLIAAPGGLPRWPAPLACAAAVCDPAGGRSAGANRPMGAILAIFTALDMAELADFLAAWAVFEAFSAWSTRRSSDEGRLG